MGREADGMSDTSRGSTTPPALILAIFMIMMVLQNSIKKIQEAWRSHEHCEVRGMPEPLCIFLFYALHLFF